MNLRWSFIPAAVALASLLAVNCSKKSPTSQGSGATGDTIKTGAAATYPVSGTKALDVPDKASGMTFSFPDGGNGTLSVAPVTSSPELGLAATKISVSYTGVDEVEILVPKTGGEDLAFVYTRRTGVMVDNFAGEYSWWGIAPSGERNGASVYSISPLMETGAASKTAAVSASGKSVVLAITSITAGSSEAERIAAIRTSVAQAVDWWLTSLPSSLAAAARSHVEGDLKYGIVFTAEGNVYDHSRHLTGPDANIELCISSDPGKAANEHTIAHEVGHYMDHVLVGYDRYVEILDRMPTTFWGGIAPHGFADYRTPRMYVTEDYAFLSDALITGSVDATDITQPMTQTIFEGKGPDARDFPSHEGFGVLMLGSLLRTDAKVTCFWPKSPKIAAPVVGAPKGDVLALVAKGARDTNELRQVIQDYLDSRGNADRFKLAAMLEPLGWSYNGTGTVVDKAGKPVKGAHVQSVSQDGTKEYRTIFSTATTDSGTFSLPRIFPGTNILRLFWNSDKDSTDVAFTADWAKPTNVTLKMGTFTIDTSPAPKSYTATSSYENTISWGTINVEPDDVAAKITMSCTYTISGPGLDMTKDGSYYTIPKGVPVTIKVAAAFAKSIVNAQNNHGAVFTVGDSKFEPKWSNSVSYYGGTQVTDKRTDTTMEFVFTFPDAGGSFNIAPVGSVPFEVGGTENGKYVVYTSQTVKMYGGGISFLAK